MAFRDIRKSRKWLSAYELRILALLLVIFAALLAANLYLARILPAGEWLYLRWNGARAFVIEHAEPYSSVIAQSVQQLVYGRNAFANEYRYVLSDPFYIVLFYTPLAVLPEVVNWLSPAANVGFEVARGVWMLLAEIALVFTVLFSFRLSEWGPPRGLYFLLIGFGLFSFFSLNALVTASPTIFLSFLYLAILLALRSFSDELAGALLLLTAYQWEVGGLFFVFILIFVIANRRWHVLMGFVMSLVILLIISFLVRPDWGLPYFRAVLSDILQSMYVNLNHIVSGWFPNSRFSIAGIVSLLLIAIVTIEAFSSIDAPFRRVVWTASLALAAMPLVGLAMFPSNYVVLLLPLVLVISLIWERWARWRALRIALILIPAFAAPFGLYVQSLFVYAPFYTELLTVLPPVSAIVALYWMRWWVLHSPRVWADQIGFRR
jgi:hypothetical protein